MSFLRLVAKTLVISCAIAACHRQAAMDDHSAHMSAADRAAPGVSSGTSQGIAGLPPSNNAAAARLAASPRHGEWVKVAWEPGSRDSLMAWIVYPSTNRAKSPVVVVVHEIFGLSTWIRGVTDQVAAEGFIAIAPDLESRVRGGPSTVELSSDSANKLIGQVNVAERNRGIAAVARYAMSQPSADQKYAVIGYCWGGQTVFAHAINGGTTGYSGGVAYYGLPPMTPASPEAPSVPVKDSIMKINKPIILLSGSKDARITAAMPALDAAMKQLGKNYMGKNYEGAIHGFLRAQDDPRAPTARQPNPTQDPAEQAANLAATKDAWPITVDFLKRNLGIK
jgi:carboxymethylenebutenolidase